MKALIRSLALLCLFLPALSFSQTVQITADVKSIFAANPGDAKVRVCLSLVDFSEHPVPQAIVTGGNGILVQDKNVCASPVSGHVSTSVYANDMISVLGVASSTKYVVTWYLNNAPAHSASYIFNASDITESLNTKLPLGVPPVVTPPNGDTTYARLDGGNMPFTGPLSASSASISGALTAKQDVDGCFTVGGTVGAANIQAAITQAGAAGCVRVPDTYAGTDTYTNTNGIPVIDHRPINGTGALMIGGNSLYLGSLVRTGPSLDALGHLIPLGNDMFFDVRGAADMILQQEVSRTTSTTSVAGAGTQNITVGTTANFFLGAGITIDRYTASEETIAANSWSITNLTTINATFVRAHTQPYNVDQWGVLDIKGWLQRWFDSDSGTQINQWKQLRNGANRGFVLQDAAGLSLYSNDPFDFIPRIFGHGGLFLFGSNGLTGTTGAIALKNNPVDGANLLFVDGSGNGTFLATATATQLISNIATGTAPIAVSSTTPVANLTLSNHPRLIASGTSTFTATLVTTGTCQTTVTTAASGALTSDAITTSYASAPGATTDSLLILNAWPTANNVNFSRCNPTAGSITPTALVLNWRVLR